MPGSTLLKPLSDVLSMPLDQTNFVVGELAAVLIAVLYRKFLPPSVAGAPVRHAVALILGLYLGWFCFGRYAFIATMGYMSFMHIRRMFYDYGGYTLDVVGPLMINTQKLTALAFSLHDGLYKKEDDLTPDQKNQAVRRMPGWLEFFSYAFYFQGILVGPLCFYQDYQDFIEGRSRLNAPICKDACSKTTKSERAVVEKLLISAVCLTIFLGLAPWYAKETNADGKFIANTTFYYRVFFLLVTILVSRTKYYFAWKLGEAVNNASGLGFSGYDENGKETWDLINNVNIIKIEFCTSFKMLVDNWNIQTAVWLRRICYDRAPGQKRRTAMTYTLSAVWHGFYPGYYFSFCTAVFFTMAARALRRSVRPFFQVNIYLRRFYDVITWFAAHFTLAYLIVPFTVMEIIPIVYFYTFSMFWCGHIITGTILVALPSKKKYQAKVEEKQLQVKLKEQGKSKEEMVLEHTDGAEIKKNV